MRGKEGGGPQQSSTPRPNPRTFPSPCGVRRVRDSVGYNLQRSFVWTFPSPCGVRRVRDFHKFFFVSIVTGVSVPLRGKEGAGPRPSRPRRLSARGSFPSPSGVRRVRDPDPQPARGKPHLLHVSVPLRGKEGAGPNLQRTTTYEPLRSFPSPCGVRRVRDKPVPSSPQAAQFRFRPLAG